MKKYIIIIIVLTLCQITSFSQDLISKYKSGSVKLVPDSEFAHGNDWENVFRSYHAYRDYRTKFSSTGKFDKEFTVEKAGHKPIMGVINGNTLFTGLDNMGKMTCSDLNGTYKKTLTLNYMTKDIIALNSGKFAVVGWVLLTKKIRTFIAIVDYETNKEKVIWEHFIDRNYSSSGEKLNNRQPFNYSIRLKKGGIISCTTMPYSKRTGKGIPPQITTINDELIVAIPNTGEILVYDLEGNLKSESKINWQNNSISVEEQRAIQQKAIDRYKAYIKEGDKRVQENLDGYNNMISEMEVDLNNIKSPIVKPSFSNIFTDSDDNVLFFEIPEEKNANVFHVWVYDQVGQFATKCSFVCDEYDLNISSSRLVFKDGFLYGLQTLKETKGNPLRLVRFKLEAN